MKRVTLYLFVVLLLLLSALVFLLAGRGSPWLITHRIWAYCTISGGIGGCLYCLRGVYLNACVRKNWDPVWMPWYFIRPCASMICGGASCLFLKAGLLLLEADKQATPSNLGFIAFAFVAGLNVDKFVAKIEDIAQATWGIEPSRASKEANKEPEKQTPERPQA